MNIDDFVFHFRPIRITELATELIESVLTRAVEINDCHNARVRTIPSATDEKRKRLPDRIKFETGRARRTIRSRRHCAPRQKMKDDTRRQFRLAGILMQQSCLQFRIVSI